MEAEEAEGTSGGIKGPAEEERGRRRQRAVPRCLSSYEAWRFVLYPLPPALRPLPLVLARCTAVKRDRFYTRVTRRRSGRASCDHVPDTTNGLTCSGAEAAFSAAPSRRGASSPCGGGTTTTSPPSAHAAAKALL